MFATLNSVQLNSVTLVTSRFWVSKPHTNVFFSWSHINKQTPDQMRTKLVFYTVIPDKTKHRESILSFRSDERSLVSHYALIHLFVQSKMQVRVWMVSLKINNDSRSRWGCCTVITVMIYTYNPAASCSHTQRHVALRAAYANRAEDLQT